MIRFQVFGIPGPQGSKRHVGNGRLIESSKKVKPWRQDVAAAAIAAMKEQKIDAPLNGPLDLTVFFRLPMPKSRPAAVRRSGAGWSWRKPDVDKLLRSTLDALTTSGLIADDARISRAIAVKVEVLGWTGATITLKELDEGPLDTGETE